MMAAILDGESKMADKIPAQLLKELELAQYDFIGVEAAIDYDLKYPEDAQNDLWLRYDEVVAIVAEYLSPQLSVKER